MIEHVCQCGWITRADGPVKITCHQCGLVVDFGNPQSAFFREVRNQYAGPIHPSKWPAWATTIAWWRHAADVGLGDTFHRIAERTGAEWVIKFFGINCGCQPRRDHWNAIYKYKVDQ